MKWLAEYGYWAVLGGTLLEGEVVLLLAGFAAQQGVLYLPAVIAVAFCGPSSVALKLGPRVDYLPPWYLPVGTIDLAGRA